MHDYYSYIFVRQDISPEQQMVQVGHVCCVMGKNLSVHTCPHSLAFVVIGVPNEEELFEAMNNMEDNLTPYHLFKEPDINDEITAVASKPLMGALRQQFKKYKTLKFNF